MISIDNFSENITKSLPLGGKNIHHMYCCSSCGYEGMLHRFIKSHGLKRSDSQFKDRRAFEMEYPGDCWQTDLSMGPYLTINGHKHKTYIVAYIDDASRAVMIASYAEVFSPQSKGKIKRWFQTLQRQWLNLLDWNSISSIEELNEMLQDYVENTYHQSIHSSIKMKLIDKYIQHIDRIRFVPSKQELDYIFLYRCDLFYVLMNLV